LEFSKNEKEKKSHKNETIFSVFVKKKKTTISVPLEIYQYLQRRNINSKGNQNPLISQAQNK